MVAGIGHASHSIMNLETTSGHSQSIRAEEMMLKVRQATNGGVGLKLIQHDSTQESGSAVSLRISRQLDIDKARCP